jgi:phosphoglycolate phosphatase-like HAD superfamily hydrolase
MLHKEKALVLDIDETLFNSVKKHVDILNRIGERFGCKNLPTYQEVLAAGGTHNAYAHFSWYRDMNERMRNASWFNKNLEVIEEALEAMTYVGAMVAFYLTTRPARLANVTYDELVRNGFPDREVICRPPQIPLEHTTPWKLDVLEKYIQGKPKQAIMVDDSHSLHKAIKQRKNPQLATLLYAGPMTPRGNGEVTWPQIRLLLGAVQNMNPNCTIF